MSTNQYLARYAEPEIAFSQLITESYQRVLCLPAYAEDTALLNTLRNLPGKESILVLLILNAPESNSSFEADEKTAQTIELLEFIQQALVPIRSTDDAVLAQLSTTPKRDILLIDRCTDGKQLPENEGVGLARKICADLACQLIAEKKVCTPWIHCSDADITFPDDYFSAADHLQSEDTAVALLPFSHTPHREPTIKAAQTLYDLSLYYYVEGLKFSGSPYSFHTIGSTLIMNSFHYAQVRGFPKRSAAEDFYLLNKLAKTGIVKSLETPVLTIETRLSERVPFGTGPALSTILAMSTPEQDYLYYHPQQFGCLKALLNSFSLLWEIKAQKEDACLESYFSRAVMPHKEKIIESIKELGFEKALNHAFTQSNSSSVFISHLHQWFDAFRTLRFIHLMRDKALASLPREACQESEIFQSAEKQLKLH